MYNSKMLSTERKYWLKLIKGLVGELNKKLLNHGCTISEGDKLIVSRMYGLVILYQGSTDPGTIKSKYIPTVASIDQLIRDWFDKQKNCIYSWIRSNVEHRISLSDTHGWLLDNLDPELNYSSWTATMNVSSEVDILKEDERFFDLIVRYVFPSDALSFVVYGGGL